MPPRQTYLPSRKAHYQAVPKMLFNRSHVIVSTGILHDLPDRSDDRLLKPKPMNPS